ncbi:MAG: hypothetical protein GX117_04085 [Candidatus Hydrogenedentes bacterium]|nr:hypothetical protein [Candidatus Hydrogenedentota bacterium]
MTNEGFGGPISSLIVSCRTQPSGTVALRAGEAVKLTSDYEVSNVFEEGDIVFGEVMVDCDRTGTLVPIRVRGICSFPYSGSAPEVDGVSGVIPSEEAGKVELSEEATARGMVVQVNAASTTVEVLL